MFNHKIKCLHICNDFLGSKVYQRLYEQLDKNRVEQYIFCPLRKTSSETTVDPTYQTPGSKIIFSRALKKYHRVLFRLKIKSLYKDLANSGNLTEIDVVNATTMYSDGALALKIKKKFDIPYIVTVRSTDIGAFNKYRPDLFPLGLEILQNAHKIIFISQALKSKFYEHIFFRNFKKELLSKSHIISNGIDQFWIDNLIGQKRITPTKILYVGTFLERKNVLKLIDATLHLEKLYPGIELTIVGKSGIQENKIKQFSEENPGTIKFLGSITKKDDLRNVYRSNHIFAMPSINETFGLVYLEALSQGLPILYSTDDGIDGTFDFEVGEGVDPKSTEAIMQGLKKIIDEYSKYSLAMIDFDNFSWKNICKTYLAFYEEMQNHKQS